MDVHFTYMAQIKNLLGCSKETVSFADDAHLQDVIHDLVQRGGEKVHELMFADQEKMRRLILVFVGDEQVFWDDNPLLENNCEITFMSPIAGGA
ncbi:MAG: MoaD/ThiS family protein [Planctomycetes bacterium]|nr:MoaD/ThiS family protein [Planctomycetota bacterium]